MSEQQEGATDGTKGQKWLCSCCPRFRGQERFQVGDEVEVGHRLRFACDVSSPAYDVPGGPQRQRSATAGGEPAVQGGSSVSGPANEPPDTGTASLPRSCSQCGKPEHGAIACKVAQGWFATPAISVVLPCAHCGDVAAYSVCGRCFEREGAGPRFQVGDKVDMGDHTDLEVVQIDAEPRYEVQWPNGHTQRIKESTLRRHVPVPAKCAPDGTRCEAMAQEGYRAEGTYFLGWTYCPHCGGKLREG